MGDPLYILITVLVFILFGFLVLAVAVVFPEFRSLIVGVEHSPRVVGWVRLLVFQLGPSLILWGNGWITGWDSPTLLKLQPLVNIAMRQVEAEFDKQLKKYQNEEVPTPPAGVTPGLPIDVNPQP